MRLTRARRRVRVPLPFGRASITIRGGTSDARLVREFLLRDRFPLPRIFTPRLIVDAGANIGLVSLYLAAAYPAARVLAIEPEASNLSLLRMNTARFSNIEVVEGALWSSSARLSIANPQADKWSFRMSESASLDGGVRGYTIDELMARAGATTIDILKIDIEGGEKQIFGGDVGWLERVRMVIIELHDRFVPDCSRVVYDAMRRYDFVETVRGENHIFHRRDLQFANRGA